MSASRLNVLAPLLLGLLRKRAVGCLRVEGPGTVRELFLEGGQIVYARSNVAAESLGRLLLAAHRITKDQYEESLRRMVAEKARQGDVLLAMGVVSPEGLAEGLIQQSEAAVLGAFQVGAAGAKFLPAPSVPEGIARLRLPFPPLVWKGIRTATPLAWIEAALQGQEDHAPLCRARPEHLRDLGLDDLERKVVERLDGRTSVRDLLAGSGVPADRVLRALYGLLMLGLAAPASGASAPARPAAAPAPSSPSTLSAEDEPALALLDSALKERQGKDHFAVLGLERGAPKAVVKKTYFQLTRQFHPDRFFGRADVVRRRADDLFTILTRAYETLTDDAARAQYEEFLRTGKTEEDKLQEALKVVEAESALGRAEALAGRNEWKRAEEEVRKALAVSPESADGWAVLGWALFGQAAQKGVQKPEGRDLARASRQALDKALALQPNHARACYVQGLLAEAEGNMEDALAAFAKATEANPRFLEPAQKMRVLQMRMDKSRKGVFGKLFK